ncbi:hypothetical protein DL96DRAFT_767851 [Flagelloscypha sp. PMI_526]|nr:hypothetical protein DL96DRAFT_767851 [Flagelloscypha sp. PMI_526]
MKLLLPPSVTHLACDPSHFTSILKPSVPPDSVFQSVSHLYLTHSGINQLWMWLGQACLPALRYLAVGHKITDLSLGAATGDLIPLVKQYLPSSVVVCVLFLWMGRTTDEPLEETTIDLSDGTINPRVVLGTELSRYSLTRTGYIFNASEAQVKESWAHSKTPTWLWDQAIEVHQRRKREGKYSQNYYQLAREDTQDLPQLLAKEFFKYFHSVSTMTTFIAALEIATLEAPGHLSVQSWLPHLKEFARMVSEDLESVTYLTGTSAPPLMQRFWSVVLAIVDKYKTQGSVLETLISMLQKIHSCIRSLRICSLVEDDLPLVKNLHHTIIRLLSCVLPKPFLAVAHRLPNPDKLIHLPEVQENLEEMTGQVNLLHRNAYTRAVSAEQPGWYWNDKTLKIII